jgi:hypothetical protein
MTAAKATAYTVAAAVHLLTLGLLASGVLLLVRLYTNPFADLFGVGAIAIAFAFVLRPRLGKPPSSRASKRLRSTASWTRS